MPVKCLNGYLYSIVVPEKTHRILEGIANKLGVSTEDALEQVLKRLGETDKETES